MAKRTRTRSSAKTSKSPMKVMGAHTKVFKQKRGFAAMSPEKRREIARKGGRA